MSASGLAQNQQHKQQQARSRASGYFSARERLLNRDHDASQARKSPPYQLRAARPASRQPQQQQQQQSRRQTETTIKMDHQEQSSEREGAKLAGRRNLRPAWNQLADRHGLAALASRKPSRGELEAGGADSAQQSEGEGEARRSAEREHQLEVADLERLEHMTPEQLEQSKQHVGPVMGIFFKVWSLVKVTRMRHNKTRWRQNSEDAGQLHFTSGDQLAPTSGQSTATLGAGPAASGGGGGGGGAPGNFQPGAGKHFLRDSHFRRAGSQPPPASHMSHSLSQQDFSAARQPSRLRVQAGAGPASVPPQTVSTTNSSSSGVSSTTSSSLVGYEHEAPVPGLGSASKSQSPIGEGAVAEQAHGQGAKAGGQKSGARGWAARIRGRASAGASGQQQPAISEQRAQQQQQSRSRFRHAEPNSNQLKPANLALGQSAAGKSQRQLRSQSELQQLEELRKRPALVVGGGPVGPSSSVLLARLQQRRTHRMRSDDYDEDDETKRSADDEIGADESEQEEDSDLNDIYSTPNDSIQSVPSTQLQLDQRRASSTAPGRPLYPMVKSLSSQNFNQIAQRSQQAPAASQQQQQQPIDEGGELAKDSRSSSSSSKTTTNDNSHQTQINSIAVGRPQLLAAGKSAGRLNSSRFFISSSSSEDSQAPNSSTVRAELNGAPARPAPQRSAGVQPKRAQIPIHFGLHHHATREPPEPGASRPNSLLFAPHSGASGQRPHLLTPSAMLLGDPGAPLAHEPTIAAMSPMFVGGQQAAPGPQVPLFISQQQQQVPPSFRTPVQLLSDSAGYKKSPSLFEMSQYQHEALANTNNMKVRFSSKYPGQRGEQADGLASFSSARPRAFVGAHAAASASPGRDQRLRFHVPNSISLHDCKLSSVRSRPSAPPSGRLDDAEALPTTAERLAEDDESQRSEYKLAQMLLRLGSNPSSARDQDGCTALMHSVLSENLAAFRCLIEHGVDLNETNNQGLTALDLISSRSASDIQMEMFNLLIENQADFDKPRAADGTRLLDRLIGLHEPNAPDQDKMAYIDCLLHNGAKLGSSTWLAASGKHEIQLRLLRKLCQDGYFLYKKCSIEAAVYRFEYALKRIEDFERQFSHDCCRSTLAKRAVQPGHGGATSLDQKTTHAIQLVKYQTYLGLSRCERKRKFFRRALEFAHMSILVDSTSYEGYYSKAHILKDIGEVNDALVAIDQTDRLVNKSINQIKTELAELQNQEESIVFDGCFQVHDPSRSCWIEAKRAEVIDNLEYLEEAKKHVSRLRCEILEDKLKSFGTNADQNETSPINGNVPVST